MSRFFLIILCFSLALSLSVQRRVHVVDLTTRQPIANMVMTNWGKYRFDVLRLRPKESRG